MGINKAILLGNVGRDPEIKSLPSGMRLATFSLATTDRRSKDENGNPRTEWHNIVAWDRMVDVVENYVTKDQIPHRGPHPRDGASRRRRPAVIRGHGSRDTGLRQRRLELSR
jgi:hypothetical protein